MHLHPLPRPLNALLLLIVDTSAHEARIDVLAPVRPRAKANS